MGLAKSRAARNWHAGKDQEQKTKGRGKFWFGNCHDTSLFRLLKSEIQRPASPPHPTWQMVHTQMANGIALSFKPAARMVGGDRFELPTSTV